MFNKLHKIIAYTLIICLLSGVHPFSALTAKASDEQSAAPESVQEETYDSADSDGGFDSSSGSDSGSGSNDSGSDNNAPDDANSADSGSDYTSTDDSGSVDSESNVGTSDNGADIGESAATDEYVDNIAGDQNQGSSANSSQDDQNDNNGEYRNEESAESTEQSHEQVNDDEALNDSGNGNTDDSSNENTVHSGDVNTGDNNASEGNTGGGKGGWYDANGNWYSDAQIGWVDDDGNWHTDTPREEIAIEKRPQTVTGRPSYDKHLGDDFFRLEVETDGDGTLMFSSSNESVIDMAHTGRAYIKGTGTAVISIYAEETESYKRSNLFRMTITVRKKQQELTGATTYTRSVEADPFTLKLTKEGNGVLIYESSNKNIATVNGNGKVTIKSVGSAKITVYAAETATCMESAAKTITVNVGPKKTALTGVASGADNKTTVVWERLAGVSGYQIQYSEDKNFAKGKVVTAGASETSAAISGLTDDYYMRIRAYKEQSGKKLYAEWSDAESVGAKRASSAGSGRIGAASAGGAGIGGRIGAASIGAAGSGGRIGVASIGAARIGERIGVADQPGENTFSTLVQEWWASEWQTSEWQAAIRRIEVKLPQVGSQPTN